MFTKFLLGLFIFGAIGVCGGAFAVFADCATTTAITVADCGIGRDTDASCISTSDPTRRAVGRLTLLPVPVCVWVFLGHANTSGILAGSLPSWTWVFVRDADAGGVFAGGAASWTLVFFWNAHTSRVLAGLATRRAFRRIGTSVRTLIACVRRRIDETTRTALSA